VQVSGEAMLCDIHPDPVVMAGFTYGVAISQSL